MQCRTTIDGGPDLPHTEHFNRADSLFSRAVTVGQAAADAAQVPTNFVYNAVFSIANQNDMVYETTYRREFSVWGSMWDTVTDDPRVPWIIPVDSKGQVLKGQDGNTPFYQLGRDVVVMLSGAVGVVVPDSTKWCQGPKEAADQRRVTTSMIPAG